MERFLSRSDFGNESSSSKQRTKSKEPNVSTRMNESGKSKLKTEETDIVNDIGDQLSSECPKMEVESDLEMDLSINSVNTDSDVPEGEVGTRCNKRDRSDGDKTVSSILEDLTTSNVPSKPSPRKKTRYTITVQKKGNVNVMKYLYLR